MENNFKDTEITKKGIDVILNVFSMIFLYTKNLDLAVEYTNNSIYYFVEYVTQISNKNTEFVFVNLTIKDAILYVYRKSIFEINETYRRNYTSCEDDTLYFDVVNNFIKTYSVILKEFIDNKNYTDNDTHDIKASLYDINSYIITFFKGIEIYTEIEDSEDNEIDVDEKNILYNITYNGVSMIYEKFIHINTTDEDDEDSPDDKESYEYLCHRIKRIIVDYTESLVS